MNIEDYIKNLDPELQEKARACGNVEELLALAKEAKVPLPDEALTAIAGGQDGSKVNGSFTEACERCGTLNDPYKVEPLDWCVTRYYKCSNCGFEWIVHDVV